MKSSTFKLESLQFFNLKFQPVLLLFVSVLLSVLSWSYNITYFFIFFSITPLLLILFDCETRRKDRIFYLFIYELFLRTGLYLPLFINGLPFISYFCVCAFEALIFCLLFLPSALILDIYSNQSNKVFFIFNWLLYEFV
ncbi:MAG: hypothetical protein Q8K92_02815, partial [Leadbetterella sp.]|nr:hypothetical protein [Leadbetterella sp.]